MKSILVIDDDRAIREILGRFLKALDYTVLFAENGLDGLEKAKACVPDLMILDVEMPQMDGISLCAVLKSDPKLRRIPILFLTGDGHLGLAEDALSLGAGAFLTKPLDFARIKDKIEKLLER